MVTIEISQCAKALDFGPLKKWSPVLPPYAWFFNGSSYLISGFDRLEGTACLLTGDLDDLLAEIYGNLTLSECARLTVKLKPSVKLDWDPSKILGYAVPSHWEKTAHLIAGSPAEFQHWLSERKSVARDVEILSLIDASLISPVLEKIGRIKPTRSIGTQILELSCHLLGQGMRLDAVLKQSNQGADFWLSDLFQKRNPQTASTDRALELKLKSLPWPAHSQVKWIRDGDQAGVEVRFQIFSDKDLDRQLEGFENVKERLKGDLWTLN